MKDPVSGAAAKERLDAIGLRVERVSLDPKAIEAQTFFRVARPLFALAGWRAKVRYAALSRLVEAMRDLGDGDEALASARAALAAAVNELEANVVTVERAAIVRARPPVAYAAWLRRAWEVVVLASRALDAREAGHAEEAEAAARGAAKVDRAAILPPLAMRTNDHTMAPDERISEMPIRDAVPEADADVRLVELELAAIDRLLDAARAEQSVLGRKRRLFVAARQRLLEACAALPIDGAAARARSDHVAREIARIDRFEHTGVSVDVGLVHQARLAVTRGDPRLAYAALAALDGAALSAGDARVASVTARAIARLWPEGAPAGDEAREASLQRSALELLGGDVVADLNDAIAKARAAAQAQVGIAVTAGEHRAALQTMESFAAGAELELARAAVAVDGCFEVGGALAPMRVVEEERILQQVRYPTEELLLLPARDVDEMVDAVVGDPRTLLLDLAAGRLLARRYMREETRRTSRVVMRSEVRVYVLDGSSSMKGPRARVRDALVVAELGTMVARLKSKAATRSTLFYRYFNDALGPVTRVDGIASARAAVRDVVGIVRSGATDIEKALVASLEQVRVARESDPDLARAQVVLVTDGEAKVSEEAILAARAETAGLPVGVSVIALGQENPALRAIVARQRAKGESAFYHFVDDAQLATIVDGGLDDGLAIHLPAPLTGDTKALARELEAEIGPLVDELCALERERDLGALERLDSEAQARREAGIDDQRDEGQRDEGARARVEALNRDRASLHARFTRWFPEPDAEPDASAAAEPTAPRASGSERDDVDAVGCVLASVAEVVALLGGGDLARRADAIELIERLLPDAHLTPSRYRAVLRDWPSAVAAPLRAIHAATRSPL